MVIVIFLYDDDYTIKLKHALHERKLVKKIGLQ